MIVTEIMSQKYLDTVLLPEISGCSYSEAACDYLNKKFNINRLTASDELTPVKIFDSEELVFIFDVSLGDFYTALKTFITNYELLLKLELLG